VSWNSLWFVVFFGALAGFAILSALIAVKGVGEIRELFAHLLAGRKQDGSGR
jgi:hypothetical protein